MSPVSKTDQSESTPCLRPSCPLQSSGIHTQTQPSAASSENTGNLLTADLQGFTSKQTPTSYSENQEYLPTSMSEIHTQRQENNRLITKMRNLSTMDCTHFPVFAPFRNEASKCKPPKTHEISPGSPISRVCSVASEQCSPYSNLVNCKVQK